MHIKDEEIVTSLQNRLHRIEGQVRGISRMLDEDRDCREVVQQLAAIKSAVQSVGIEVMRTYATQCLSDPESEMSDAETLDYLFTTFNKWA